jgi:hypothetical protein
MGWTFGPWFGVMVAGYFLWAYGSPIAALVLLANASRRGLGRSRRVWSAVLAVVILLLWLPVLLPELRRWELERAWSGFWAAAQRHDDAAVEAMLKRDPSLSNDTISLMSCGVQTGSVLVVSWALDHGAKVNAAIPPSGWPPLLQSLNAPAVTHLLLEHKANPDGGSVDWTPLSKAVHEGNAAIVEDLLAHHARIDLLPPYGDNNPLHVAAKDGNRTMCELLLRSGANPSLPNKGGLTAADLAQGSGHSELAAWLRQQRPRP